MFPHFFIYKLIEKVVSVFQLGILATCYVGGINDEACCICR